MRAAIGTVTCDAVVLAEWKVGYRERSRGGGGFGGNGSSDIRVSPENALVVLPPCQTPREAL